MISVGNNKAVICKGDFHPAQLYKGDKKIAGYTVEEFSAEGNVTLENCYNDKLHNTQIFGNSIQDGTPTPEAPVEVQSEGELVTEGEYAGKYKIPIRVRGKNLFKPLRVSAGSLRKATSTADTSNNYGTSINTTDATEEIIVTQTKAPNTSNLNSYTNGFFCIEVGSGVLKHGKRYTLSFDCEITNSLLNSNQMGLYCNGDGSYSLAFQSVNGRNSIAFTYGISSGNDNYLEFRIAGKSLKISNIMITDEDGTPIYEPHIEPQTFNIYLGEPLRKLGEFADYVDFEKQKTVRNVRNKIFTGNERSVSSAGLSSTSNLYRYSMVISEMPNLYNERILMSNYFATGNYVDLRDNTSPSVGIMSTSRIAFSSTITTLSEFKNWIKDLYSSNPLYVCYPLKEPIEEPIELPELPTFKGTTIYEIDTEIPATISGKYKKVEV